MAAEMAREVGDKQMLAGAAPWLMHDSFVADTAIKMDRLQVSVAKIDRDLERNKAALADLKDSVEQNNRFHVFEQNLRHSREYKLEEMLRCFRDAKARLDKLEGSKSVFAGLPYNNFESINKRLEELSALQKQCQHSEQIAWRNALLFYCTLALLLASVASHYV